VSTQLRAGWRLLPLTVGPQASCTTVDRYRSQVRINPRSTSGYAAARLQGRQEAVKTVAAARALGISARSTLWYDIESYDTSITSCRESALSFLSAWTKKLHSLGYVSGVYSSAGTGISALDRADAATPGKYAMPDQVWHARWDGVASTASTYFRPTSWMPHRRVHQYLGDHNETHGGVTINIDSNYLDLGRGSVAPAPRASCGVKIDFATYPTLQLGDTRSEAAAAQCLLKNKGFYAAAVGGALDATTMAALNAFQRNRALPVTSSLTGSAWTALLADGRQSVLKQGSASHGVRRAQRALNAALGARPLFGGPPVPALVVDGVFGASTTTAVRLYQQRTGVPVTGVLAADTWEELSIGSW
jgi:peptidoglycan hydrolase-like protein with peptidoglycan-binding domain